MAPSDSTKSRSERRKKAAARKAQAAIAAKQKAAHDEKVAELKFAAKSEAVAKAVAKAKAKKAAAAEIDETATDQQKSQAAVDQITAESKEQKTRDSTSSDPSTFSKVFTSAEGLLCGLKALELSITHQLPEVFPPTVEDLTKIATKLKLPDINNYADEQLEAILKAWGKKNRLSLKLGIVLDAVGPYEKNLDTADHTIWIHNDADEQLSGATVLGHWSGMKPPSKLNPSSLDADGNPILSDPASWITQPAPKAADQATVSNEKEKLLNIVNEIAPASADPHSLMNDILRKVFKSVPREEGEKQADYAERVKKEGGMVEEYLMDALLFQKLGTAQRCVFFDPITGEPLVPADPNDDVRQHFLMKYDRHMPNFTIMVSRTADSGLAPAPRHEEDESDDEEPDIIPNLGSSAEDRYESQNLQDLNDINIAREAFEHKDSSISRTGRVSINYESLEKIEFIDVSQLPYTDEKLKVLKALPKPIILHCADRVDQYEGRPIFVWLKFDAEKAAKYRIHMGVPSFAQIWADQVKTGNLTFVIDGDDVTMERLTAMQTLLETYQGTGSPLKQWFLTGPKRYVLLPKWINTNIPSPETFRYQVRLTYHSWEEYLVRMAVSIVSKRRLVVQQCDSWSEHIFNIRLADVPNANGRVYSGWIELPDNDKTEDPIERPSPGTVLQITFESQWKIRPTRTVKQEVWTARVTEGNPGPPNMVPVTISRPWDGKLKKHSDEQVRTISTKFANPHNLAHVINNDAGNKVRIFVQPQLKVNKAQLNAVEAFNYKPKGREEFTQFNQDVKVALIASNIHTLEDRDLFIEVRAEFGDVTNLMRLNRRQRRAIQAMAKAKGGIAIIQGPSGTGKSEVAIQAAIPFYRSEKKLQVLYVTSANTAVDTLARKGEACLDQLRKDGLLKNDGYIIRLYSQSAERSIRDIETNLKGKRDTSAKRPANIQGEIEYDLMDKVDAIFIQHYMGENAAHHQGKFAALRDKRVVNPEFSLALKTLEVIGHVQGKDTFPDVTRFAQLRGNINLYVNGMLKDEKDFGTQMKDAMDFTLTNAKAVFATMDYASLDRVLDVIEKTCNLVIADECPKMTEESMIALLECRMPTSGIIMMGDMLQLGPTVTVAAEQNVYAAQDSIAWMSRLIHVGFPYSELIVQHRMNERLCGMANELTYDGKLRTHDSARHNAQQKSRLFSAWVEKAIGHKESFMLVDVRSKEHAITELRDHSRFCELFVVMAVTVAELLLNLHPQATVAMVTGYTAQRDRLLQAAASLARHRPDLFVNADRERLVARTVDGTQGEEYDYVIDTIMAGDSGLGFQADAKRGNVATTRARHGYVLIADFRGIRATGQRNLNFVGRLLNILKEHRSQSRVKEFPPCLYYTPFTAKESVALQAAEYYANLHASRAAEGQSNDDWKNKTTEPAAAAASTTTAGGWGTDPAVAELEEVDFEWDKDADTHNTAW